jgi:hypothetical protein
MLPGACTDASRHCTRGAPRSRGFEPPPTLGVDWAAGRVVGFFKPGVDILTRFLPMLFVPALVILPLSARPAPARPRRPTAPLRPPALCRPRLRTHLLGRRMLRLSCE